MMTGKKLKELRDNKKLTQVELALMIGASERTISSWETGDRPINGISETALLSVLLSKENIVYCERPDVKSMIEQELRMFLQSK